MNIVDSLHKTLLEYKKVLDEIITALDDEDTTAESLRTLYENKQVVIDRLGIIEEKFPEEYEASEKKVDEIRKLYTQIKKMDAKALKKISAGVEAFSTNIRKVEQELKARDIYAADEVSDNSRFITKKLEG